MSRENIGYWFAAPPDEPYDHEAPLTWHRLVNGLFHFTWHTFPDATRMLRFTMFRPKHSIEFIVNWSFSGRDVERHEHWNTILAIGLWGGYIEESPRHGRIQVRAPYIRFLPRWHRVRGRWHRVRGRWHRVRGRWVSFSIKWPFKVNKDEQTWD